MWSLFVWPKVIALSGFYFNNENIIWKHFSFVSSFISLESNLVYQIRKSLRFTDKGPFKQYVTLFRCFSYPIPLPCVKFFFFKSLIFRPYKWNIFECLRKYSFKSNLALWPKIWLLKKLNQWIQKSKKICVTFRRGSRIIWMIPNYIHVLIV